MKKVSFLVLILCLIASLAFALDKSTTFQVKAFLNPFVYIVAYDLNFGSFTQGEDNKTASTNIYVEATYGLPYVITLNGGQNAYNVYYRGVVSYADSSYKIPYLLYHNGTQWGDYGYGYTNYYSPRSGTGTGYYTAWQLDGTLWNYNYASSSHPDGMYSDTVTVTVYY